MKTKKSEKIGVVGFYISIIPIALSMIVLPIFGLNDTIIWPLFFVILLLPIISLFLCIAQLRIKKTKLAIAGIILSFLWMFRNWITLRTSF